MRNASQRSLLGFIALRIIAPLSIPLLALLVVGVVLYQQLVASLIFDRESELGELAVWDLRLELSEYSDDLHYTATSPDLLDPSPDVVRAALENAMTRIHNLYDGLIVIGADGAVFAFAPESLAHILSSAMSRDEFVDAPAPLELSISNVVMDSSNGSSGVMLGVPIQDPSDAGRFLLGYFVVPDSDMIEVLARLRVGGSGFGYLVDRNGRVIYHPDYDELGVDFSDRSYVQALKAGQHGGTLWDSSTGQRWIVDYTPITEAGWGLVVKEPYDVAVAPAIFYGWLLIGLGLLVVAVVLILLWTGVRRIASPIEWLSEQTAQLAVGEEVQVMPTSGIVEIDNLGRAFERMGEQIIAYRHSLRHYIGLLRQSQEDERRRIARELHDETVQELISIARQIELLQDSMTNEQQRERWSALRTMVTDAARGVRQISRDLRPPILEDLGLVNALHMLADTASAADGGAMRVAFSVEGEPLDLHLELELTLFRIAQEAISNIRKHAHANSADIRLRFRQDEWIELSVCDDGVGFEPPGAFTDLVQQGNLGLMGIQERAWVSGGRLEIQSRPGNGTRLEVAIPVSPPRSRPFLNHSTGNRPLSPIVPH